MKKFTRVLVLSPTPTHPQNFGNRNRIFNVCKAIKTRGVPVDLLHYPSEWDWRNVLPSKDLADMTSAWDTVFTVPPTRPLHTRAVSLDHEIDEWWDPAVGHFLDWLFHVRPYTHFIVNYTWLSRALLHAPPAVLRILDTHDRFAGRRELLASLGVGPEFFHTTVQQEKIALDRADMILAIKDEERVYFSSQTDVIVATLIHAEAPKYVKTDAFFTESVKPLRIGFLGARNSINKENFRAFLDIMIPSLRKAMASIEVVLAGALCQDFVDYHTAELILLGYIDDVASFYEAVDVVVAPISQSTGLKIKVGEALAFGKPIIALRHAFEGYEPTHRYHTLDGILNLVRTCITLSFDRNDLPQMAMLARVSHRRSLLSFDRAIDRMIALRSRGGRLFLVCVDRNIANYRSASGNRQIDLVRYIAHLGETIVYVTDALSTSELRAIEDFTLPATKVISSTANPDFFTGTMTSASLAEVLEELPITAIWLSAMSEVDKVSLASFTGTILYDAESPSLSEPFQVGTGRMIIAHYPSAQPRGEFWRSLAAEHLFPVPYFMSLQAELRDNWRLREDGVGVVVLVDEARKQSLDAVLKHPSLCQIGEETRVISKLPEDSATDNSGFGYVLMPLDWIAQDLRRIGPRPVVCIDMCEDREFAFLCELMLRSDVPVLPIPRIAQLGLSPESGAGADNQTLLINQHIDTLFLNTHELFENDAGWCQIWGLLSQL